MREAFPLKNSVAVWFSGKRILSFFIFRLLVILLFLIYQM